MASEAPDPSLPSRPGNGVVYTATGQRFVDEAARSAASCRLHNPRLPIALVTDANSRAADLFDPVIRVGNARMGIADKLEMQRAPFERVLFLDTDTLVLGPLDEVFDLLGHFDLVYHQPTSGYHYRLPGVPPVFSEPNTGVIGWRRGPGAEAFFANWRERFLEYEGEMGREWDQRSFRHAVLLTPGVRPGPLTAEFNFMPYKPKVANRAVVVMHGRPFEEIERVGRLMNERAGPRAYVPKIGVARHHADHSVGELFRLAARYALVGLHQGMRRAFGGRRR